MIGLEPQTSLVLEVTVITNVSQPLSPTKELFTVLNLNILLCWVSEPQSRLSGRLPASHPNLCVRIPLLLCYNEVCGAVPLDHIKVNLDTSLVIESHLLLGPWLTFARFSCFSPSWKNRLRYLLLFPFPMASFVVFGSKIKRKFD